MKKFIFTFALLVAVFTQIFAAPASASFTAQRNQVMQVFVDGQLLNRNAKAFVRTPILNHGLHYITLRFFAPNGSVSDFQTSIDLAAGFESQFVASKIGRRGHNFAYIGATALMLPPAPICHTPEPPIYQEPHVNPHYGNNGGYNNGQNGGFQNVGNNGYNGGGHHGNNHYNNSPNIMTAQTLQAIQNSIRNASFERNKLMIAKQAISGNGSLLYAQDVKTMMAMFSFEGTRVEFAKFAYDYTYDRQNYFQINDGFQFSSSVVELNQFLQGRN